MGSENAQVRGTLRTVRVPSWRGRKAGMYVHLTDLRALLATSGHILVAVTLDEIEGQVR